MMSQGEAPFRVSGLIPLSQEQRGPIRIFMVHGMSDHSVGWAETTYLDSLVANRLAQARGWSAPQAIRQIWVQWTETDPAQPNHTIEYPATNFAATLRSYEIRDGAGETVLVAYELTWSRLTETFKLARFGVAPPNTSVPAGISVDPNLPRPFVNQTLRAIIDERLSDVALYASGFDNHVLNKTVEHALEQFYEGTLDSDQSTAGHERRRTAPTAFLSESLGSIMLTQAFKEEADRVSKDPSSEAYARFSELSRNLGVVYMMANQIALLDMPKPEPAGNAVPVLPTAESARAGNSARSWHDFADARNRLAQAATKADIEEHRKPITWGNLTVAAFTDLYDILSYRVDPSLLSRADGFEVDNFYPSNAFVWLGPFGIYYDPDKAHSGYGANNQVTTLMLEGYSR
jgi:hypothetical protein